MEMKSLLKKLVEIESPSADKAAVDRVGAQIVEQARNLGAKVEAIRNDVTGDHVLARWGNGVKGILLLCHMDTVFPAGTLERTPYREADGKIYGPGVLDMKSGIAISLAAIEDAMRLGGSKRPITLLCTSDEEIGSLTSQEHIEKFARESALVLVMESAMPDGALKTWRKGVGEFRVRVKGRAAHAGGDHEAGRNAIEEMAHQILAIQRLTNYSTGTTLNVGVIHGGTVSNVVPEQADIQVDVRVMQAGEWERLEERMKRFQPVLEGTSLEIAGGLNRPPMPFDERMKETFTKVQSIAAGIGMELKAGGTGGGSDANFVAPLGIPVMDGLGAVGEGHHSDREYILAESLETRKRLLAEILTKW